MMSLHNRRSGQAVTDKGRIVAFSFWPSRTTSQGPVAQTRLFAIDPWAIIRQVVENECSGGRTEALACLAQAQAFFEIGTGQGNEAARPLALYYSYLNAAKAYCLTRGTAGTLDGASHGLKAHGRHNVFDFADTYLQTIPSSSSASGTPKPQMFDQMMSVLTDGVSPAPSYEMSALAPQILSGHRLWVEASNEPERFFNLEAVTFRHNSATNEMWLEIELLADDIGRFGITSQDVLSRSGLVNFEEVVSADPSRVVFQESSTLTYGAAGPLAELDRLVQRVRHQLWMTVMLIPPYRRYYLYLSPQAEAVHRLPQLLSMYAVTYFFGSITRYRPDKFDDLLRGPFGPRVRDFITGQPRQFVYQLASEMARRDVARPSIL
jgi:hypothetical protein